MNMFKTLLAVVGVTAVVASPAFAKSHTHAAPQPAAVGFPVVVAPNGHVIGSDPDPRIRAELLRDFQTSEGASN